MTLREAHTRVRLRSCLRAIIDMTRLLFVVLGLLLFPLAARAVVLTPSAIDVSVLSGETASADIVVRNDRSDVRDIELSVVPVTMGEEGSWVFNETDDSWVYLHASSTLLLAGESQTFGITINPTDEVRNGIYTFGVIARERQDRDGRGFALNVGFMGLVFVTVGVPSEPVIRCIDVQASNANGLQTRVTLKNEGGGILQPRGTVLMRGISGRESVLSSWNTQQHRILPGQERVLSETVQVPWHMFGRKNITIVADGTTCPSALVWIWPSLSVIALAAGVSLALAGSLVALRLRRH